MATKPQTSVTTVGSQRDNRFLANSYDQHKHPVKALEGRPWHGYREHNANKGHAPGFCSPLSPGRHVEEGEDPRAAWATVWHAPWMPEERFFEFNFLRGTHKIRYDQMIGVDKKFYDDYFDAAAKVAYEKNYSEVIYGAVPAHGITAIIGAPPRSPKIAEAAQAGDPWLLGFSEEVNTELAKLLGMSKHGIPLSVLREAPVSVESVLSVPQSELARLIADGIAKAMAAHKEEESKKTEAKRQSMANARSQRKPKNNTSLPQAG